MRGGTALPRRRLLRDAAAVGALAAVGPLLVACTPAAAPVPSATPEPPKATPLPPPETTTIRLPARPPACDPYFWMGDDLLREEGFTQIDRPSASDLNVIFAPALPASIDAGRPLVALAGTHVGCVQAWAIPEIAGLRDLRGKRVPVAGKGTNVFYTWWVAMLTSVGVDPEEVTFVLGDYDDSIFLERKVDAILVSVWAGPLLARAPNNPGRKMIDTSFDKPWSQHFCCLLTADRDWARSNPVAAKRATRAMLRAQDLAAADIEKAMRVGLEKKLFPARATFDALVSFMKDMPMEWRDYDPEDTLRFYALRLADGKVIKKTPPQILSEGADFAYFKQLRKELKP